MSDSPVLSTSLVVSHFPTIYSENVKEFSQRNRFNKLSVKYIISAKEVSYRIVLYFLDRIQRVSQSKEPNVPDSLIILKNISIILVMILSIDKEIGGLIAVADTVKKSSPEVISALNDLGN